MDYSSHRPRDHEGHGDSHLPKIVRRLRRALAETQSSFAHDTLRLPSSRLANSPASSSTFAEDLHDGTGIWAAYERYNIEFFGTALPLTAERTAVGVRETSSRPLPPLPLGPVPDAHRRTDHLADAPGSPAGRRCRQFLPVRCLRRCPQGLRREGVPRKRQRARLGREAEAGLARHALLHVPDDVRPLHGGAAGHESVDIAHTDDFVCQECTRWSGLGAIDILAGVLDISDDDRRDLRSWYERHAAFYKILSVEHADTASPERHQRPAVPDQDRHEAATRSGGGRSSSEASSLGAGSGTGRASSRLWAMPPRLDMDDLKRT